MNFFPNLNDVLGRKGNVQYTVFLSKLNKTLMLREIGHKFSSEEHSTAEIVMLNWSIAVGIILGVLKTVLYEARKHIHKKTLHHKSVT